jgi:SAM-dependent methyltransferase
MGARVTEPKSSPKEIVARGYDRIAEQYATWAAGVRVAERERYTQLLLTTLSAGAAVLELGCGAGTPTTQRLAERFAVTGVDISERQITLAQANVPTATFLQADMTVLDFAPASFDGVCAFYAITHVPRDEHANLLRMIAGWLRPDGLFVASFSNAGGSDGVEDDFLGAPMFFSGYDAQANMRLVQEAGFEIVSALPETDEEFGQPTTFLWIVARTPANSTKHSGVLPSPSHS